MFIKKWIHLFREKKSTKILFKHKSWNHEIKFISEKQSKFEFIYSLSKIELKIFRKYLNTNLKKKFIKKSKSSTKYSIFFTFKKDDKFCLCVDYRKLNDITIKNWYSLSNINELQNKLQKIKIFIKIDFRDAYNLIRIKKNQKWMTIFRIRYEFYEYTIMSFELTNVSTTYQKLINNAFKKYLNIFVIAYFDDIFIYSQNSEKHVQHVHEMFRSLNEWDLLTKFEKCVFHVFEMNFLKFLIDKNDIRMNSNKTTTVKNWKWSKNVIEILTFLNFTNYNRRFIKRYSHKMLSLTKMTQKKQTWNWNDKTKKTFQKLK